MALVRTILEIYSDVQSGTENKTQFHVPSSGLFRIMLVEGEAAFDVNVAVIIKFDGVPVWLTKGSSKRTELIELEGDGVKKLEIVLDATDLSSGSVYIGAFVKIEQET